MMTESKDTRRSFFVVLSDVLLSEDGEKEEASAVRGILVLIFVINIWLGEEEVSLLNNQVRD
jgi:hypothetical protein